ncbi:MAG: class I SAM-dependent methyltransferase [Micromonosporaceae bacterium]
MAAYYERYRRGYPPAAVDAIAGAFGLQADDVVVDLGCGTGQLSLPLAARVRAVVGMDPEPDMLTHARRAAKQRGVGNTLWMLGADSDLPALGRLLSDGVGAVTIAVAIHWMDRATLFPAVRPLLRRGGGIAVVTNGTPLWLQDTEWSRTLRKFLQQWLGRQLTSSCQTDDEGRRLNQQALTSAGYRVVEWSVDYEAKLTVDEVVGGVFSAMSVDQLPPPHLREQFAAQVRDAIADQDLTEHVRVWLQLGHST